MIRIIFILSIIANSIAVYSQTDIRLQGVYCGENDTLIFHHDSVTFSIMSNGGFRVPMEGSGKFIVSDAKIIIQTGKNLKAPVFMHKQKVFGDREYLEDKTLVFKINEFTQDLMNLTLIGLINNPEFKSRKTIKKWERDHKKLKFRERQLQRIN